VSQVVKVPTPIVIAKSQPFEFPFRFWADKAKTQPEAITSAEAELRRLGAKASAPPAAIAFLQEDGHLEIADGATILRRSEADLSTIEAGEYELVHSVIYETGAALQLRALVRVIP
jgi:hypothetical protein